MALITSITSYIVNGTRIHDIKGPCSQTKQVVLL